ncbi:MAG: Rieske 2Fe-2S domain-containing protein, partial [Nitrospinota bacterium]|nr:Rieske 2Fe-2S domain-containing protein [Nitrospinota bacterium]
PRPPRFSRSCLVPGGPPGGAGFSSTSTAAHTQAPLDFRPGQFLNLEKTHILCANHGALFDIRDGRCVAGPRAGERLQAVAVEVRNGVLYPAADNGTSGDRDAGINLGFLTCLGPDS